MLSPDAVFTSFEGDSSVFNWLCGEEKGNTEGKQKYALVSL